MSEATTAIRAAIIAQLKADSAVAALVGGRVHNVMPGANEPGGASPLIGVTVKERPNRSSGNPTGAELEVNVRVLGSNYRGQEEGELILGAVRRCLEAWIAGAGHDGVALAGHTLANLEFTFGDVEAEDDGRSYAGLQTWRAVTNTAGS